MVVTWRLIAKTCKDTFLGIKGASLLLIIVCLMLSMAGLPSLLSANYWKFPCASNVCVYVCQPLWKGPQPDSQWNICVIMSTCVAYQLVLVQWYLMAICLAFEAIWIHLAYHDDQMHSQPLNTSNSNNFRSKDIAKFVMPCSLLAWMQRRGASRWCILALVSFLRHCLTHLDHRGYQAP